ncbi:MAG: hypothetical protein WDZ85_04050 [Candidatus Paceibacterota bacterium]
MTPRTLARIIRKDDVDPLDRIINTLDELSFTMAMLRQFDVEVCLTSGSFDLAHIGHARYTRRGWREVGSDGQVGLMLVAIEDDEKITKRKGPHRPVIPFLERAEFMAGTRWVDIVITKKHDYPKWEITKIVRPDVLLAVTGTYSEEQIAELGTICHRILVVPRQAENSTSAQFRRIQMGGADELKRLAGLMIESEVTKALDRLDKPFPSEKEEFGMMIEDICGKVINQAHAELLRKSINPGGKEVKND